MNVKSSCFVCSAGKYLRSGAILSLIIIGKILLIKINKWLWVWFIIGIVFAGRIEVPLPERPK